jgi:hypothetical protein
VLSGGGLSHDLSGSGGFSRWGSTTLPFLQHKLYTGYLLPRGPCLPARQNEGCML